MAMNGEPGADGVSRVGLIAPQLVPRVWGGLRLSALLGPARATDVASDIPIGEAWFGEVGSAQPLVKLLDVEERLSVQVHPDDQLAAALHGAGAIGKHEAWVILDAKPDAHLLLGRDPSVLPERLAAALAAGDDVAPLLAKVKVAAGDVLDVPPGMLHALMPGLLVWEAQQSSDHTYRVSDWGRNDANRPLHRAEAIRATDPAATARRLAPINWEQPGVRELTACGAFRISVIVGPWSGQLTAPRGAIATLIGRGATSVEGSVGDRSLRSLQCVAISGGEATVELPSGASLLVAQRP